MTQGAKSAFYLSNFGENMFAIFHKRSPLSPLTCRRAASSVFPTREEAEAARQSRPLPEYTEVCPAEATPEEAWGEYGPDSYWEVA